MHSDSAAVNARSASMDADEQIEGAQLYANCSKNATLCQSKNPGSWGRGTVL